MNNNNKQIKHRLKYFQDQVYLRIYILHALLYPHHKMWGGGGYTGFALSVGRVVRLQFLSAL